MKVMISMPMAGKHDDTVRKEYNDIVEKFKKLHIEVVEDLTPKISCKSCSSKLNICISVITLKLLFNFVVANTV